jgi:hypothetical protein
MGLGERGIWRQWDLVKEGHGDKGTWRKRNMETGRKRDWSITNPELTN